MNIENTKQLKIWQRFVASTLLVGAVSFSGCGSLSLFSNRAVADDQGQTRFQSPIAKIMGPTERRLRNDSQSKQDPNLHGGSDADLAVANKQLQKAKELYDDGRYAESEKAFKALVAQRRERYENFGTRLKNFWGVEDYTIRDNYNNFGDPVEEDAIFLMGESQFAQKRYTRAQDSYDDLLNQYPSTRHMDRVTKQMFRIAQYWLDFPSDLDTKSGSEIQLVSNEEKGVSVEVPQASKKSSWRPPIIPNLTDKTRPAYDADGRGLLALRSIWLHDATGPLADDALMLAANHNLRTRNFVEAKRLYELLRDQYPDSSHYKDAYLLGSHVTLASYEGPEYDGKALDSARDLKQTMLQIFPDITSNERKMLQGEIDQLHDAEVARLWSQVEFYQRKNVPESVALHCNLVINRYPNSPYAQRARGVLQALQSEADRSGRQLWAWGNGQKPTTTKTVESPRPSRESDPRIKTESSPQAARVLLPQSKTKPITKQSDLEEKPKRSIFGFLRKAEEPPKLEPIPPPEDRPGKVSL